MLTVLIYSYKMVLNTDVWVTTKGELGRAGMEVVRLDAHVVLFRKFNDPLERECNELNVIMSTFHMKDSEATTDNR